VQKQNNINKKKIDVKSIYKRFHHETSRKINKKEKFYGNRTLTLQLLSQNYLILQWN